MSATMTTVVEPSKAGDRTETHAKPEIGLTGRKIVYDKDGKPCRTCNTLLDFQFATGKAPIANKKAEEPSSSTTATTTTTTNTTQQHKPKMGGYAKDDPPDVAVLGRSTWTLLHSIAATYPETPSNKQQQDMKQFINLFSGIYPCWFCAEDFQKYIKKNEPKVANQDQLGKWFCEAHNDVNIKLGKPKFNCDLWKKRWKDGWDDEE